MRVEQCLFNSIATSLFLVHWALSVAFYLLTVAVFGQRRKEDEDNPYRKGNFRPVPEAQSQDLEVVEGALPLDLDGAFVRVGPNPALEPIGRSHWFDGDAMVHAVRIRGGRASYAARFVCTERLESEVRWGWPIEQRIGDYHGWLGLLALALDYCKVVFGLCSELGRGGTANTSIVAATGRIMALHEADLPYELVISSPPSSAAAAAASQAKALGLGQEEAQSWQPVTAARLTGPEDLHSGAEESEEELDVDLGLGAFGSGSGLGKPDIFSFPLDIESDIDTTTQSRSHSAKSSIDLQLGYGFGLGPSRAERDTNLAVVSEVDSAPGAELPSPLESWATPRGRTGSTGPQEELGGPEAVWEGLRARSVRVGGGQGDAALSGDRGRDSPSESRATATSLSDASSLPRYNGIQAAPHGRPSVQLALGIQGDGYPVGKGPGPVRLSSGTGASADVDSSGPSFSPESPSWGTLGPETEQEPHKKTLNTIKFKKFKSQPSASDAYAYAAPGSDSSPAEPPTPAVLTVGRTTLLQQAAPNGKQWVNPFTAHPKLCPETGELFFKGYRLDRRPYLQYGCLGPRGDLIGLADIPSCPPIMMHDWGLTDKHVIFVCPPLDLNFARMVTEDRPFIDMNKKGHLRLGVAPRLGAKGVGASLGSLDVVWYDKMSDGSPLPSVFVSHVGNAWESEEGATLTLVTHGEFDLTMRHFADRPGPSGRVGEGQGVLREVRLDAARGTVSSIRALTPETVIVDMPRCADAWLGQASSRFLYAATVQRGQDPLLFDGVVKVDRTVPGEGKGVVASRTFGAGVYGGEPVHVAPREGQPESDREDSGYLAHFVHDSVANQSFFELLLAADLSLVAKEMRRSRGKVVTLSDSDDSADDEKQPDANPAPLLTDVSNEIRDSVKDAHPSSSKALLLPHAPPGGQGPRALVLRTSLGLRLDPCFQQQPMPAWSSSKHDITSLVSLASEGAMVLMGLGPSPSSFAPRRGGSGAGAAAARAPLIEALEAAGLALGPKGEHETVPVYMVPMASNRFALVDPLKNDPRSPYHVRVPEAKRSPMSPPDFVSAAASWPSWSLLLDAPLLTKLQPGSEAATAATPGAEQLQLPLGMTLDPATCLGRSAEVAAALRRSGGWAALPDLSRVLGLGVCTGGRLKVLGSMNALLQTHYAPHDRLFMVLSGRLGAAAFCAEQAFGLHFEGPVSPKGTWALRWRSGGPSLYPYPAAHPLDGFVMPDMESLEKASWPGAESAVCRVAEAPPGALLWVPAGSLIALQALEAFTALIELSFGEQPGLLGRGATGQEDRRNRPSRTPIPGLAELRLSRVIEGLAADAAGLLGARDFLRQLDPSSGLKRAGLSPVADPFTLDGFKRCRAASRIISLTENIIEALRPKGASDAAAGASPGSDTVPAGLRHDPNAASGTDPAGLSASWLYETPEEVALFLACMSRRRLLPTPWLNANAPPVLQLPDIRTEDERRFPELFALTREVREEEEAKARPPLVALLGQSRQGQAQAQKQLLHDIDQSDQADPDKPV